MFKQNTPKISNRFSLYDYIYTEQQSSWSYWLLLMLLLITL